MWLPHPGRRVARPPDVRTGPQEQGKSTPRACGTEDDRGSRVGAVGYADLKRRLSMCRALSFDSRVEAGTPSCPAAPKGPATRPLQCVSAASMASFSWVARVPGERRATGAGPRDGPASYRGSIERVSE